MFDFDCNFTHPELVHQTQNLIQVARKLCITQFLVPGASIEESKQCIQLAEQYPNVSL